MARMPDCGRVLVVGNEASVRRAGLSPGSGREVELVDSLEEAVARCAAGNYAKIVVDPDAFEDMSFEVLAAVREGSRATVEPVSPRVTELPNSSETSSLTDTRSTHLCWSWLPLPALAVATALLALLDLHQVFEPWWLMPAVNSTVFLGASLVCVFLAGQAYLAGASRIALSLGAGMLTFGLACVVGAALVAAGSLDSGVIAHNLLSLVAGGVFLIGAVDATMGLNGILRSRSRAVRLAAAYATSLAVVAVTGVLSKEELIPAFVTHDGTTPLRSAVLTATVAMFAFAAVLIALLDRRARIAFLRWYWLGLALIAAGLAGVALARVGTPLSWVGRIAQAMGQVYVVIGLVSLARGSKESNPAVTLRDAFRRLEGALRESEQRFRTVIENSRDGINMLDLRTGKYVFMSPAQLELTGFTAEELEGISAQEARERVHPDDREVSVLQQKEIAQGRELPSTVEYRWKVKSGEYRWFSDSRKLVRDEHGEPAFLVGVSRDITERKEAEEALRASNERLTLISDAVSRILESDRPHEIVNDLCTRVMQHLDCHVFFNYLVVEEKDCLHLNACAGVSDETAESLEWLDYGTAVCGCVARDGDRIVADNIPEANDPETEFVASLGIKAYACHPLLAENGRVLGTLSFGTRTRTEFSEDDLGLMRTIADHVAIAIERLEIQEDLRRSEERYRTIFETAPTGMVTIDLVTKHILTSNRAFHQMLGYAAEEIAGKTVTDITHPDDIEYDLQPVKDVVEGRGDHFHVEKRYLRKDGGTMWGHLTGSVVRGPTGEPLYGIGLVQDITEQKLADEAQRRYELLADNSRDIILFVRRDDGRILEANTVAVEAYGCTREELLGLTIADLRIPEARDLVPEQMAEADARGILFETMHRRRNGDVFPVEVGSRGANIGDTRVLISVVRDITDRKKLEGYREEMLKRERRIAETLQEAIVPAEVVSRKGDYAFYVVYEPAYKEAEIGGDFYDVFDLGDGKVGVLIGDVAGKGLAAAMHVAAMRYAVRGYSYMDPRPGRVLAWANDVLCKDSAGEARTLTAFFAVVDTHLHTMVYASAGHEPPIAIDRDGRHIELSSTGTLLGMLPGIQYAEESLRIDDFERIVMFTDGITEARRQTGELFAEGRLVDYLLRNRATPGPIVAVGLTAAAMEHAGGPLHDDAAVVVLERVDHQT